MNLAPPRVSVVLPVRNGARFLADSLRSMSTQTFTDWELVAVDDGSTDATPRILAECVASDSRVRVIRNDTARCLPGALNRGFSETHANLLTWTSDDNAFRVEALASMVEALDRRPDIDVVYADYEVMDAAGFPLERKHLPNVEHLGYSNIVGPCFLFRRRVWELLGGYAEDLFLAEDYDFWLRAVPHAQFLHLERDLYRYRVHETALGTSRRTEVRRATATVLRRNLPHLSPRMRYEAITRLEHLAMESGDVAEGRAWRRRALRLAPFRTVRRWLHEARSRVSADRSA